QLLQDLELFGIELRIEDVTTGDVTARTGHGRGEAPADQVHGGNDRNGGGFVACSTRRGRPECDEDRSAFANQLTRQRRKAIDLAIGAARLETDRATRNMSASGKQIG